MTLRRGCHDEKNFFTVKDVRDFSTAAYSLLSTYLAGWFHTKKEKSECGRCRFDKVAFGGHPTLEKCRSHCSLYPAGVMRTT